MHIITFILKGAFFLELHNSDNSGYNLPTNSDNGSDNNQKKKKKKKNSEFNIISMEDQEIKNLQNEYSRVTDYESNAMKHEIFV